MFEVNFSRSRPMFKVGDRVYCLGGSYLTWAKGKTATVNKTGFSLYTIQVRFDEFSEEYYNNENNGHSGLIECFTLLTKLHKAMH